MERTISVGFWEAGKELEGTYDHGLWNISRGLPCPARYSFQRNMHPVAFLLLELLLPIDLP